MSTAESRNLSKRTIEGDPDEDPSGTARRSSIWWLVWIPVIVVVVLWIGGWWFGNYGGPWQSKPRHIESTISDPAVAMLSIGCLWATTGESSPIIRGA